MGISGSGGIVTTASANGIGSDGTYIWQNTSGGTPTAPSTLLSLSGLNPNQDLTLEFTFLAIGSWDGSDNGVFSPDFMNVDLNSMSEFQGLFRNYQVASEYPGSGYPGPGANITITQDAAASGDFGTAVYDITITGLTADSSGNADFAFYASGGGWQGGSDESIGLDNIEVTSSDVATTPEPASWLLFAFGIGVVTLGGRSLAR